MGTQILSDFRANLQLALGNRSDAAASIPNLNRWINQAYSHVCQPEVYLHKELETTLDITLTATTEYDLETLAGFNILGVRDVVHYLGAAAGPTVTRRNLEPRSINELNLRTSPTGAPVLYALEGNNLVLGSLPGTQEVGQVVRVWLIREPTPLVLNADTTLVSSYWDQVIELGAQWKAEWQLGYRFDALATKQEYVSMINEKSPGGSHEFNIQDTGHRANVVTMRSGMGVGGSA